MQRHYTTLLQLTDLHLFAEPCGLFNGINSRDSFLAILRHVKEHYRKPDVIMLTGDLAHDGKPQTYQYISEALEELSAPVYFVLGNHDNPCNAHQVYPRSPVHTDQHLLLDHWQIIMLDSNHNSRRDSYEGEVSESELRRLAELSQRHSGRPTLIALHHNLPTHDDRGVVVEVRNYQQVMQHIEKFPNIKAVISGHIHQEFLIVKQGICYLSTPSTSYQSTSKSGRFTGENAGYRWFRLYDDGSFETDVRRLGTIAS
jgi:Icc protein